MGHLDPNIKRKSHLVHPRYDDLSFPNMLIRIHLKYRCRTPPDTVIGQLPYRHVTTRHPSQTRLHHSSVDQINQDPFSYISTYPSIQYITTYLPYAPLPIPMSTRVIQDSDDEDDPLSCVAQPPPPPPTIVAGRGGPPEDSNENGLVDRNGSVREEQAQDMNATNGTGEMGINFDDFLQSQQSQDANARGSMSLSQQRREERWIPSGSGSGGGITRGSGSIG